jgi:hypothetical protein
MADTLTVTDNRTGKAYTLPIDLGSSIRVEVIASDAGGAATAESTSTDPVGPAHPGDPEPVAGDPSIAADSRSARR